MFVSFLYSKLSKDIKLPSRSIIVAFFCEDTELLFKLIVKSSVETEYPSDEMIFENP